MQDIDITLILVLIIIIILIIVGIVVFFAVKKAMFKVKNQLFNVSMTFFNTPNLLDGIKKQKLLTESTPKSISAMTSVYLPNIKNDFPNFNYDEFKQKAENLLLNYFTAISNQTPIQNVNITDNVALQINSIISQLQANNYKEHYENIVLHRTEIKNYIKSPAVCKIIFQTSLGNINYIEDASGRIVFGDKVSKEQTIYETELIYVQEFKQEKDSNLLKHNMLNCPNCGGPISDPSAKFCEYCGTGIKPKNVLVWNFNSIKEVSGRRSH